MLSTNSSISFLLKVIQMQRKLMNVNSIYTFQMFYTLNGYTMYDYHTLSRKIELHGDGETYSER